MGAEDSRPPAMDESAGLSPQGEGGQRCRQTVAVAVRAMLDLLEEAAVDGRVSMAEARRVGNAVIGARGPLSEFYGQTETCCDNAFAVQRIERQRADHLGRLIAHTFSHLLDEPGSGIERKHLVQFFAAVRMMVGEEAHEELRARTAAAAERHRAPDGLVDWEAYYADPDSQAVLEQVLVSIVRSFRRFEPRKDWFLIVMNSNPATVSLGSNVFVAKKAEDKVVREFTEVQMCRLFKSLLAPVRPETFDAARRKAFAERWGADLDKVFGVVFIELKALCQQCGLEG